MIKVRAHACYFGKTGYASHSRSFLRSLSTHVDLRVRNFSWDSDFSYIDDLDLSIVDEFTLSSKGRSDDFSAKKTLPQFAWKNDPYGFVPDVDLVLVDENHKYFFDRYDSKVKIAYTVWESTKVGKRFFDVLKGFDFVWVVSKWHKKCLIDQGFPSEKICIVNEGVSDEFRNDDIVSAPRDLDPNSFNFVFFGRWDYRKFVPEIIETFTKTFDNEKNVKLILCADNPFGNDGMKTTEERLKSIGCTDERVIVKHFLSRDEYVSWIKHADAFISCARSEGWNIPLIEAMAAGTPSIYSNWGAQLEFAKGKGIPVAIKSIDKGKREGGKEIMNDIDGFYAEPDKNDLSRAMMECFTDSSKIKKKAKKDSIVIREMFDWKKIGNDGYIALLESVSSKFLNLSKNLDDKPKESDYAFNCNFMDGPFIEILGTKKATFFIEFIDEKTKKVEYKTMIENNHWAKCSLKYVVDWKINVKNIESGFIKTFRFEPEGKNVIVSLCSSSLGDTLAWISPAMEFSKKWKCNMFLSTFKNEFFEGRYNGIKFINPGTKVDDVYAMFSVGWFYDKSGNVDYTKNPSDFKTKNIQESACDILGLDFVQTRPLIKNVEKKNEIEGPYVCLGIHSTAQCKYWNNPTGWQDVVDKLKSMGKKVVVLSKEDDGYMGNSFPKGIENKKTRSLDELLDVLKNAEMFIGVGSGLSWLSWALEVPTIIISGFSLPISEPSGDGIFRVFNENVCNGCFNKCRLDPGDWNWCPYHKGTKKMFECSKEISSVSVFEKIDEIYKSKKR